MQGKIRVAVVSKIEGLSAAILKRLDDSALRGRVDLRDVDLNSLTQKKLSGQIVWAVNAPIVVADPPLFAPHISEFTGMQWLQSTYAGVDALFAHTSRRDYICTRGSLPSFGPQMSEWLFGWILAIERRIPGAIAAQASRIWAPRECAPARSIDGLCLGILGVGNIGTHVARTAKAFGMRTVGFKRNITHRVDGVDHLYTSVDSLLSEARCDYIVNFLPSSTATRDILSSDRLSQCRYHPPIFLNAGRGDIIAEDALIRALDNGWIKSAVLDVFQDEPVPQVSKLWSHEGVYMTPHVAAMSFPDDVADLFVRNLDLHVSGNKMTSPVNWDCGY